MTGNKMITLLAVVVSMAMTASAAKHIVGGSAGWTIPSTSTLYTQWASSQKYAVGDTLLFNFTTGIHNVMEVPKASYDSCSSANEIGSTLTKGPATVTLTTPGNHYFICGVTGHCNIGQKLAINVISAASSAPAASVPKSAAPKRAPKAAPASSPISSPASSPTVGAPAPSLAPSSGLAAGPGPSISPSNSQSPTSSPIADSPTTNVAPSGQNGGSGSSLGPTAAAGPSGDGNSASSAPVSMLSGGYLWSILVAALFSTAFLW